MVAIGIMITVNMVVTLLLLYIYKTNQQSLTSVCEQISRGAPQIFSFLGQP